MNSDSLNVGVNLRQIGGIPKRLHIFRSGRYDALSIEEVRYLQEYWNVYHLVDLRTPNESLSGQPVRLEAGSRICSFPLGDFPVVFRHKLQPSAWDYASYYFDMLAKNQEKIKELFIYLTEDLGFRNFVVGCSAGKDRTGVVCYLIQMLARVELEQVVEDYCLSSEYINLKLHLFAAHWEKRGITREQYQLRIKARPENILLFHKMFLEHYKSIEHFFECVGFSRIQIDRMIEQLSKGNC